KERKPAPHPNNREHEQRVGHHRGGFVALAGDFAARVAEKDDHKQADNVKGRQKSRKQTHHEDQHVAFVSDRENCVLAEKSAERRTTDQGQRTGTKGEKCDRKIPRKPTHFPNVLLMMEHHDHGTGSEKEERLKKCVSKKVKHGRFI